LEHLGLDDKNVNYIPVESHNTLNKKSDNTKAKRDLDLKMTIPLKEGIPRTIDWQKKIYENTILPKFK
jgi:dTDP-glucose 4,6-dehydratase